MIPFLDTFSIHENLMCMVTNFENILSGSNYKKVPHSLSQTFSDLQPEGNYYIYNKWLLNNMILI